MLEMAGQQTREFCVQIDFECVLERFRHESNSFPVGRPGCAFAEPGKLGDVWREFLLRITLLPNLVA